jgi:hypothetical protein
MIDLALNSNVFINNAFEEALQELDIILGTQYTELIGYPNYGSDFEQFLWHLNPETNAIIEYVNEKIQSTLYLRKYKTEVFVDSIKGEYRMIYDVKINIYDSSGKSIQRQYQFR